MKYASANSLIIPRDASDLAFLAGDFSHSLQLFEIFETREVIC